MKFCVVIVLCAMISGIRTMNNLADIPCGKHLTPQRLAKVVGGANAKEGEFPWLVSITRRGGHFCGGSIISNKHILTAGHCMCSGSIVLEPSHIKVTIGQHDLTQSAKTKYEMSVQSIINHPDYSCDKVKNDMAILVLEKPIVWSSFVIPACLPSSLEQNTYNKFENVVATVAGWGWTKERNGIGSKPNTLQKAKVNVIDNPTCKEWYKSQGKKTKIQETQMCAGYEQGGIDACWADSGGPLMASTEQGEVMIIGVVSTGIGCARPFLPGLYTRVSEYIPWIKTIVEA